MLKLRQIICINDFCLIFFCMMHIGMLAQTGPIFNNLKNYELIDFINQYICVLLAGK